MNAAANELMELAEEVEQKQGASISQKVMAALRLPQMLPYTTEEYAAFLTLPSGWTVKKIRTVDQLVEASIVSPTTPGRDHFVGLSESRAAALCAAALRATAWLLRNS